MSDLERLSTEPATETSAGYRPISAWAVVAGVAGLAAPLAFISPLLWILPVAGIVLAVVALRDVQRAEPPRLGRKLAWIGFFLSLGMLAAAPMRWQIRNHALHARATAWADLWFQAIGSGEPQQAYQLKLPAASRTQLDAPLEKLNLNEFQRQDLDKFFQHPPVKILIEKRGRTEVKHLGPGPIFFGADRDIITEQYEVAYPGAHGPARMLVDLVIERLVPVGEQAESWRVYDVVLKKPGQDSD